MKDIVFMEAASKKSTYQRKYKCPYCDKKIERAKLHIHIQNEHEELIPEGYTALRVAFNTINNKTEGHCIICGNVTDWNEDKGRYERLCNNPRCREAYKRMAAERNKKKYGAERLQSDPRYAEDVQKKALAGRKISGKYKFKDGGEIEYVGTYEKKLLEFLDSVMNCKSEDVLSPGPSIEYIWNGAKHLYISDFYYTPYNLIIEVKDGGDNPNNKPAIKEYKTDRQVAKEDAVKATKKYNYIRLTNNDFGQLMGVMAVLKYNLQNECYDPVIRINESAMFEFSLLESQDKSTLDKNFKKKSGVEFYIVDTKSKKFQQNNPDGPGDPGWDYEYHGIGVLVKGTDEFAGMAYVAPRWILEEKWLGNLMYSMYVNKKYRGYGVSTMILKEAINKYNANLLWVNTDNEVGINLYKKNGFKIVDTMKDKDGEESYIMTRPGARKKETGVKEFSLLESEDKSTLDKNFKSKSGIEFDIIDIGDKKAQNIHKIKRKPNEYFEGFAAFEKGTDNFAGFIKIWIDGEIENYVGNLIAPVEVEPRYRGYGLGKLLVEKSIKEYDANLLWVTKDNEIAVSMYKKLGFKISDSIIDKTDNADCYIMTRPGVRKKETGVNEAGIDKTNIYYRMTYEGTGIYEAYHQKCSWQEWREFLNNKEANQWLKQPNVEEYKGTYISLFTANGYRQFNEKVLNIFLKKLDKRLIVINKYTISDSDPRIVYKDENQIVMDISNNPLKESYIINEKDIYYNKEKFDSGEINLCFITGHSGSGKSTMARDMSKDRVEHYELDDLQCIKDHFTMSQLKEYGDLIYSYFNGPGKKFYVTYKELVDNNVPGSEYEDKLFPEFVHYAMKYADSHKDRKFVIEGVWLFCKGETGKYWFRPEEFKNYAFYIKGTSMIISKWRGSLRDAKSDNTKQSDVLRYTAKNFFLNNWKYYLIDEKEIKVFRDYFKKMSMNESYSLLEGARGVDYDRTIYSPKVGKIYFVKDYRGINHAVVYLPEYNIKCRGRSEVLIVKDNMIYLTKDKSGLCSNTAKMDYDVPGGSWNPGEDHAISAKREAQEEARITVSSIYKFEDSYCTIYKKPHEWVANNIDPKDQWAGYYTEVYVADYKGRYNGYIKKDDRDDMLESGKFYPIDEVYPYLCPIHQKAINEYKERINESVSLYTSESDINYNQLYPYNMIIVGEKHKNSMINVYKELLSKYKFDYLIAEFADEDRSFTREELREKMKNATNGSYKYDKNRPCDFQYNYWLYELAYEFDIPLIGCNRVGRKFSNMNDEDKYREPYMLSVIQEFERKGKCLVQLGDHHLRSIPISKKFLEYCGDVEDDRGLYKGIDNLIVNNSSPIWEKYKNSANTVILRVKSEYDNERRFMKNNYSVNEDMSGTIGAALPPVRPTPSPIPYESDPDNYYIVQHPKNNVFAYSITKDPLQYSMFSVDPQEKGFYKVFKTDKGKIDKRYLTFKIKDKQKAKELYEELIVLYNRNLTFTEGGIRSDTHPDFIYSYLTDGSVILDPDQLLFDNRFELVKDFASSLEETCDKIYDYLKNGASSMDTLSEQVNELEGIIYG